jgi:hypothetical protein
LSGAGVFSLKGGKVEGERGIGNERKLFPLPPSTFPLIYGFFVITGKTRKFGTISHDK